MGVIEEEKSGRGRFTKTQLDFIEDGINKTRFLDRAPDRFQKLINVRNYEELSGAEFFFLQAAWTKELMEDDHNPAKVKARTNMAHVVQGMHMC